MSRKTRDFGQLIEYMADIAKTDTKYNVYQHVFSRDEAHIETAFQRNADFLAKRKNGNYMYHEILSIKKAQRLEVSRQKEILRDIAYAYIRARACENLVYGTLHDDHEGHLHYHLLISANGFEAVKRTRLTKHQFDTVKKTLEQNVLSAYPELEQAVTMNREAGEKLSRKGAEQKRRTGRVPERERVKVSLQAIFSGVNSKEALFIELEKAGLKLYVRGKTIGITDSVTGRNHRLKTLGLLDAFHGLDEVLHQEAAQSQNDKDNTDDTVEETCSEGFENNASDESAFEQDNDSHRETETEPSAVEVERSRRKREAEENRQLRSKNSRSQGKTSK